MDVPTQNSPHVAINAHLLSNEGSYRSAGIHQYILHLLRHLGEAEGGPRYTALLGRDAPVLPAAPRMRHLRSRWPTGRATARAVWEQLAQPWTLRRIGAHLLHAPAFVGPVLAPCPVVVTIHDLSFIRFPELFRPANRLYLAVMTRISARRARRIIAVSAHTRAETARLLNVPADRIDVVYHGVEPIFRPLPAGDVAEFRRRRGLPERFVLAVGTLEPRKNHARLLEAFARVRDDALKLAFVGGKGWLYDALFARVEELGLRDAVIFPGYVPNEELPYWYNAALCLVYPSIYEGFGLPVLEAQACGAPVLTSNCSSLPEAAGDAAVLVDPYDVGALAEELHRLLSDAPLRDDLRARGLLHARRFSWPKAAQETAGVYLRALKRSGG